MIKVKKIGVAELALVFSILVLVIIVAVPVLLIFTTALFRDGQLNIKGVLEILHSADTYQALKNSLVIAIGTTITSTIIGVFFAWLIARTDLPFKKLMKALFMVPFMLPSFICAMAWKVLLSPRAGYLNKMLMSVFNLEKAPIDIMSLGGIIAIETMYLFPFVFLQVSGALERMDPTLEESARISGAGLFTITRKITLPLVMPSIVAGALLVCLYSLAHFGVPAILGTEKGIYNIPTKIYERIYASAGSFEAIRTGTILSMILVIAAAIILKAQNMILKKGRFQIIAGKSMRPVVLKLRGLKIPLLIISIVYILITVVLPTVTIFLIGGLKTYGLPFKAENMTWLNYIEIFKWKLTKDAIWNSLYLSISAAFVTMLAGVMISYVIVKMKVRGKFILEFLGVLPFSLPGTVIALGCILVWSGKFGINIYNTAWIIFVAYIARYMAFALKSNSAALEQVSDSLEEASRSCGATHWQTLKNIVIPLIRPGMISAFFLIFLPALRELTTSVLLYGPTTRTIGVAIYALNEDGETVRAAALASVALLIIFIGEFSIRTLLSKLERRQ
ncbi:ABC transporter permease [Treponema phagedenis]|uniref:ABC transporter permease n=2 Tax=Treponema phagedenis TaxID=162 RepID=UPI0011EEFB9A|nr:iron ABC transporter permease [Treponema phagedenis]TYT78909.1 iron ABC transporter permease [Treponema phagedenis]